MHAAEPAGSDGVATSDGAVNRARGLVEAEFELVVGTVDHDVFHNILVPIIQRGVGQIWVYPIRNFLRTYTDKISEKSKRG